MQINKNPMAEFFDNLAPGWDEIHLPSPLVINRILEFTDLHPGHHVLDVACGTGALFPYYLERKAEQITGVDLSSAMIAIARRKFPQSNIHLIRADIRACRFDEPFDRCVVYNSFSYFTEPEQFLPRLVQCVKPGGRITIAQSHRDRSEKQGPLSRPLPEPETLARMLAPWFVVDVCLEDQDMFAVSGVRNDAALSPIFSAAGEKK